MTDTEQRSAATKFYNNWRGIGDGATTIIFRFFL